MLPHLQNSAVMESSQASPVCPSGKGKTSTCKWRWVCSIGRMIWAWGKQKYSKVSFCDGSFYDDSLLRTLSSRTEHSRLVVHHCHNSSALSVLSALLALFRCACVSSFSILVQFFTLIVIFPPMTPIKKIKTVAVTFFLDVFWTTAWAFFNKIKSDWIDFFFQLPV